ncbi:MAG TPA: PQQ-binding-like beta-propeller repeat protein [Planctomycetaceae bacterium]|nr:PQQ-binding-like beta-propeller repeat protein [Planctomycetaceae bacterium]
MNMKRVSLLLAAVLFTTLAGRAIQGGENWPQWRGPHGNGISDSTGLPTTWSLTENIVWTTELPSWSGATPIVWGDRVFVTSPAKPQPQAAAGQEAAQAQPRPRPAGGRSGGRPGFGRPGGGGRGRPGGGFPGFGGNRDPGGSTLLLICLSRADGRILWQRELDEGNRQWGKQNSASPSPVTDGRHVWVVTGTGAVAAFDMDGEPAWQRNLQDDYGRFGLMWGYASSPLLFEGKLIIEVLHGNNTDDPSYLVAFDRVTGEELWRHERETDAVRESPDAYTTPVVVDREGHKQIVVSGGDYVTGHDPETGDELWRAGGLNPDRSGNWRIVPTPIVVGDMLYVPTRKNPLLAFRLSGNGDATRADLVWTATQNTPDVPTPVCDGTYFYMVEDRGVVTCLDAKTGETVWGPERTPLSNTSASPVLADGRLYITNENGATAVLAAGPEYKLLAMNELDESYTLSTPAIVGRQIFIRTSTHLYCIADESRQTP